MFREGLVQMGSLSVQLAYYVTDVDSQVLKEKQSAPYSDCTDYSSFLCRLTVLDAF